MSRRNLALAGAAAALTALLVYIFWPGGNGASPSDTETSGEATSSVPGTRTPGTRTGLLDRTPAHVSGVVLDQDGQPVAGATVSVVRLDLSRGERSAPGEAPEPIAAVTDRQGRFRVRDVGPGRHSISAAARGYLPGFFSPLVLGPGEDRTGVEIRLERGGHNLTGTVSDIGGGPVQGALVRATNTSDGGVFDFFRAPATTASELDGTYGITLPDGGYMVEVHHRDYVAEQRFVELRGGDRTEDFALVPGGVVYGEVRSRATDEPVAGATVTYTSGGGIGSRGGGGMFNLDLGGMGLRSSTTDADGAFTLRGLTAGSVEVRAFGPGYASREPTEVALGVAEEVSGVVVYVDRAFTVSGYVVDADDDQVGLAGVLVGAFNFGGQFHLARESTAEDGYFEIHGVQNGSYMVGAAGEDRVVSPMGTSITVENADVTDVYVKLDAGAVLAGRVEPPSAARVSLQVDGDSIGFGNMATAFAAATVRGRADDDGTFELRGVPAGTFRLAARTDDGATGTLDIEVDETDQRDLVIRLEERGRISGTVVDETGAPAEGLRVSADRMGGGDKGGFASFGDWFQGSAVTRPDGTFDVVGLEAGTYGVTVRDDRDQLAWAGIDDPQESREPRAVVLEGTTPVTGLRLRVEAMNQTIEGVVVGPDGAPVPDAWVTAYLDDPRLAELMARAGGDDKADAGDDDDDDDRRGPRRGWREGEKPVLTDGSGRFTIGGLRDGTYDLEAEGLKGSARGFTADVRAGSNGARVELEPLASITGKVTHLGEPVSEFVIEASGPTRRRTAVFNPEGHYRLPRLDPGTYTLSVIAEEGRAGGEVEVSANQNADKDLQLIAYGSVRGVLLDAATGEPMVDQPVAAFSHEGGDTESLAMSFLSGEGPRTDDQGRFRVGRLGAGKGSLIAFAETGGFDIVAQKEFELAPGEDLDLGEIHGTSGSQVPRDERGTLGMTVVASTWESRPRPPDAPNSDRPDGIAEDQQLLWVATVEEGGPAEAAGIETGDRIVSVAGADVAMAGASTIERMLRPERLKAGQPVAMVIEQGGRQNSVSVVPAPMTE